MNYKRVYLIYGVLKRAFLGLSLIYCANDLPLSSMKSSFVIYTDDKTILLSHKSQAKLNHMFNKELANIYK